MEDKFRLVFFFAVAFITTYFVILKLNKLALKNGIVGKDMNKSSRPKLFHIAGIGIVTGFFLSSMLALAFLVFSLDGSGISLNHSLAILLTFLSLAFLGLVDDVFDIPQWVKALLPMFASIPFIVLKAVGSTVVYIPFIGNVDLGLFYLFVIIPLAISGSANLSNIFAGINGLEALLSIIMYATSLLLGIYFSKPHLTLFSSIMLGSLIAFFCFNKYPSKVFPGDVGTLVMGGTLSALAIVDNLESFVPILFIPHLVDLVIKLKNGLPSKNWWLEEKGGYLIPPKKPISLLQHTVKKIGKIKEEKLVLLFAFVEMLLAVVAISIIVF